MGELTSSTASIKEHLNYLKDKNTERRDEEVFRFIMKRILKYIHKTELKDSDDPLDTFYNQYFDPCLTRTDFISTFKITKEWANK